MKIVDEIRVSTRLGTAIYVLLLLLGYSASAQTSCSCPPLNTCFSCTGGLTYLKMSYTNSGIITSMTAKDDGGALPSVFQNGEITINSHATGQPFDGDVVITITKFNGNESEETISSSCASPLFIGDPIKNFTVVDAASMAGPICCSDPKMDHVRPSLGTCPTDISVFATPGGCTVPATWTPPTATDNCGNVVLTSSHQPGNDFSLGTTLVTYTATDDFNNTRTCSFNVIVSENSPPLIKNCPSDIIVSTEAASCTAVVTWVEPTASDCTLTSFTSNIIPGSVFQIGVTTITYTASDESGNTVTCSFTVTVTDNTAPVFATCPAAINLIAGESCNAVADWVIPSVTDNCTSVIVSSSATPGDTFPVGTTSVIYTATDAAGNTATCNFTVTVTDKTAPVFVTCPGAINLIASQSCNAVADWVVPAVTDNCTSVTVSSSAKPGDTFSVGITSVIYTATDATGNSAICQFDVIVSESSASFTNCPIDITIQANESEHAIVTWKEPGVLSPCSNAPFTSSHSPGDTFPIGTTTVTYTLPESSCQFNIVVVPTGVPTEVELEIIPLVTPDNDGINDSWLLPNIEQYPDNKVILLDRWGGLIYEASGYNNENVSWSGTNTKGALVPSGTYFYTIIIHHESKEIKKKGFIELIR